MLFRTNETEVAFERPNSGVVFRACTELATPDIVAAGFKTKSPASVSASVRYLLNGCVASKDEVDLNVAVVVFVRT